MIFSVCVFFQMYAIIKIRYRVVNLLCNFGENMITPQGYDFIGKRINIFTLVPGVSII